MSENDTAEYAAEMEHQVELEKTTGNDGPVQAEAVCRVATKEELLNGEVPEEKVSIKFLRYGLSFTLRKIRDVTEYREISEQAEMLRKRALQDEEGKDFFIDENLAYRMAMLAATCIEPQMSPYDWLRVGRVRGDLVGEIAGQAMLLNVMGGAEVEVLKNA